MHKTLHTKLTAKHHYNYMPTVACDNGDDMLAGLEHELSILRHAAKDLLQPRPEAVSNLMKMARTI